MSKDFSINITVTLNDLDTLNHVNNAVYVQWMEVVATKHWAYLTTQNPFPNYIWVVMKHEIDYKNQAFLGDEITAKTWVGETKGFTSVRHIAFYKGDILLVAAKTIWAMLDATTQKPVRIRENVLKVLQIID
ncbi:MAG: acyl-CoA thioesterase [Flavobacteriia bacterium]|nr:acyl-CoA thioesterase [Flavobacteriia bacterium]OIP45062.1 MAG: thioesterase [Flavobacteriaceae bacterium CG2_30_31_66]PIV95255.1 MAG: thioesterase [Flavobacteriaceae bacterium CG17_big_fil_post_rev_8_21_14_2_50_31_13]PIX14945.1 MAG: thioesterase [Flavobacteriaceae bacterium CG_4_8_14_3_um_filter_31_8]PIY13586.1 MAG: thioesterase [Flavobacteriaceae bacterium CG_4_10_14_3_um_filter_31_253]PIZ11853.1 MAG: thioesterase [Flavobacteriaceae bacterium CG_4_10_14_0_8_um_filter_31_99]PJC08952.1 MAG